MQAELNALPVAGADPSVKCPSCGRSGLTAQLRYPSQKEVWSRLTINCCGFCGFGYVPKVDFSLHDYYAHDYGDDWNRTKFPEPATFFGDIFKHRMRIIARSRAHARLVRRLKGRIGSYLDFGCGVGATFFFVKPRRAYAVEYDPVSLPYLEYQGVEVIDDNAADRLKADLVVASHFVEHLEIEALDGFLARVRRILNDDGLFLIEVPEWGFLQHQALPKRGGHEPHTLFFSPESLLNVLKRNGFAPEYLQTQTKVFDVKDGEVHFDKFEANEAKDGTHLLAAVRKAG